MKVQDISMYVAVALKHGRAVRVVAGIALVLALTLSIASHDASALSSDGYCPFSTDTVLGDSLTAGSTKNALVRILCGIVKAIVSGVTGGRANINCD